MSRRWLMAHAPGFSALPSRDRTAVYDFVLLWTLFEAQVMSCFARVDRIVEKLDEWRAAGTLGAEHYDAELAYFRRRYFRNGAFTEHFPGLNLRPSDHPALVRAVIDGTDEDPRDRVLALLLIIWRLRNNLFHGGKWSYRLRGQRSNFQHASAALMRILERHGNLGE